MTLDPVALRRPAQVIYLELILNWSFFRHTITNWFSGIGMHTEVKDPDDKIILSRVYNAEGEAGENILFYLNMT